MLIASCNMLHLDFTYLININIFLIIFIHIYIYIFTYVFFLCLILPEDGLHKPKNIGKYIL